MELGLGIRPVIGIPMPGFVPKVIIGSSAFASSETVLSKVAPSSVGRVFQWASALSHAAPFGRIRGQRDIRRCVVRRNHAGACARFDRHVANGHARFHRQGAYRGTSIFDDVFRPAANSNLGDERKDDIFRRDARFERAVDADLNVCGRFCSRHCVARTCSTSLVPMPNASAPSAPWWPCGCRRRRSSSQVESILTQAQ